MEITIKKITELDNGVNEVLIDMDDETKLFLINYAFLDLLRKGLDEVEKLHSLEGTGVEGEDD